jgi:hypothetical protein
MSDALGYAAGVGPRSAGGQPLSALPTVGAGVPSGQGAITPRGLSPSMPHGPIDTPMPGGTQNPYGQGQPMSQQYGARTPQPGAMTAAGFTSSQPVPGVPGSGKWKIVLGVLALLTAVSAVGGVVFYLKVYQNKEPLVNGAGLAPPPPPASSLAAGPSIPTETPSDRPGEPSKDAPGTSSAGANGAPKPTFNGSNLPPTPTNTKPTPTNGKIVPPLPSPTPSPSPSPTPTQTTPPPKPTATVRPKPTDTIGY